MTDKPTPGKLSTKAPCGALIETETYDTGDPLEWDRHERRVKEHVENCKRCKDESKPVL